MDGASLEIGGDATLLEKALTTVESTFESFSDWLNQTFVDSSGKAAKAGEMIGTALRMGFDAAVDASLEAAGKIAENFSVMSKVVLSKISSLAGPVGIAFASFATSASDVFSSIYDTVSSTFSSIYSTVSSVFGKIQSVAGTISNAITSVFSSLSSSVQDALKGAYSAVTNLAPLLNASVGEGLSAGFAAFIEDESALTKMGAILKATGGVAGFTKNQLFDMAEAAAAASGAFGGDKFLDAQSVLLQFKNVRADVFSGAMKAAEDFAVATGTDLSGAADKLGRALNDPIKGMRILRSEGVVFSEAEQKLVEQMLAAGKVAEAQGFILKRLEGTFGGAAAAASDTFAGSIHKLNEALDDQWKAFAQALVPAIEAVIPWLIDGANATQRWGDYLADFVNDAVDYLNENMDTFRQWYDYVVDVITKAANWIVDRLTEAFTYVQTAVQDLPTYFEMVYKKLKISWEELSQGIKSVWEHATVFIENLWNSMLDRLKKGYYEFNNSLARVLVEIPGVDKILGVSKDELHETLTEMLDANKKMTATPKREVKGTSQEDKDRLAKLRQEAEGVTADFNNRFNANLSKNMEFVDGVRKSFSAMGLDSGGIEKAIKARKSAEDFVFAKDVGEESGTKGAFEDLVSLQKRIASSAFKSPEAKATDDQTTVIKQNHKEFMQQQKELMKELKDANKKTNAGATAIEGNTDVTTIA